MANKSKAYWLPMPCIALFFFETAKLFKPIGVPISCHPIQLVQPWSPSRKPLKFSTKRRSQCSSHIASFWTMKVRSISKWDQHPSQLFGFSMVGSQRGMPACHSWSHWGNSLKPETKRSRKSIVKIQVMETIICLTSRKQIHQPRKKGLLHHPHVWWPSLWVTNLWIAWYLARGQPDLILQFCWSQTTWTQWFATWDQALPLLWSSPPNPTRPRSEAGCSIPIKGNGRKELQPNPLWLPIQSVCCQHRVKLSVCHSFPKAKQMAPHGKKYLCVFCTTYVPWNQIQFAMLLICNCHGCVPKCVWRGPSHQSWHRWHLKNAGKTGKDAT